MHIIRLNQMLTLCALLGASVAAVAQLQSKGALALDHETYEQLPKTTRGVRGPLPKSASLELMLPQAGYQGDAPSCVAWAASYAKAYRLYQRSDRTRRPEQFLQSPAYIQAGTTGGQCTKAVYVSDALRFMADNGSVSWSDMPYSDSVCPAWEPLHSVGLANLSSATFRLDGRPKEALQQIKAAIADGTPVILTIDACRELVSPVGGRVDTFDSGDASCAPHAVLAVGYDDRLHAIRVLNSWGRQWGEFGKAWIAEPVLAARLREAHVDYGPGDYGANSTFLSNASRLDSSSAREPVTVTPQVLLRSLRSEISGPRVNDISISGDKIPIAKWSIWLDVPTAVYSQIDHINYYFEHPTFRNPKVSKAGSSIFLADWFGYGCVKHAFLIAYLKDRTEVLAKFDFCKVLVESNVERDASGDGAYLTGLFSQSDREFEAFLRQFARDLEFAQRHARGPILAPVPVLVEETQSLDAVAVKWISPVREVSVATALSMGRIGRHASPGAASGASAYVDDRHGGFYACVSGQFRNAQCSDGSSPLDFSRDETGHWWLTGVLQKPQRGCFWSKTQAYSRC